MKVTNNYQYTISRSLAQGYVSKTLKRKDQAKITIKTRVGNMLRKQVFQMN